MKTIPPICPEPETGLKYWRSLDQLADRPDFNQWVEREFAAGASLAPEGESRREWMKLMSASFLFAGLGGLGTGCRRPEEHLTPFAKQPEGYVHGVPQHFATSMPTRGTSIPLVVKSSDGRPTKIEGNSLVPNSNGGTDIFAQGSILNLYDPDRSHRHTKGGSDVKIEAVRDALSEISKKFLPVQGSGLVILAGQSSSPTRARLQATFSQKFPQAKWCTYEAIDLSVSNRAYSIAFGAATNAVVQLDRAKRILSLDCDFLAGESDAYRHIRGFSQGRKAANDSMNRLYVVEALSSLTGANADHRLRARPSDVIRVAAQVAQKIGVGGELGNAIGSLAQASGTGSSDTSKWAEECAKDLIAAKGEAVVVAGYGQPLAVHLLVAAMNQALGAIGKTVVLQSPMELTSSLGIADAVGALNSNSVDTLVVLGSNPAYDAPSDLNFSEAVKRAKSVIRLGYYEDETSAVSTWHLSEAHYLESWGDGRTGEGHVVPVQPLIEPLFGGLTEIEILARVLGEPKVNPIDLVRDTLKTLGADSEEAWKRFLHDGFLASTTGNGISLNYRPASITNLLTGSKSSGAGEYDVVLFRDAKVDDGRFNNNGWLQEVPDPITKVTWENTILISPKTARDLGVYDSAHAHDGQYHQHVVRVSLGGRSIEGPVWVQPGLAEGTVGMGLGYGRSKTGRVGSHSGFNAYSLSSVGARNLLTGAKVERVMRKQIVSVTQEHGMMEGRPVIREANLEQFKAKPTFAHQMDLDSHLPHYVPKKSPADGRNPDRFQNIYEHPYDKNPFTMSKIHQWGMVVDLSSCVGCSACVIACQSENNIPIVGKDQVARGREMHWMRIDRYYSSDRNPNLREKDFAADPQVVVQPMFCQHCESAPCESVCPVNATVHDEEGLNVMAYNRCIGTRYCANNCPYKVRRFNFFDYNKRETDYAHGQDQHFLNVGNLYKGAFGVNRNEAPEWEIIKLVKNPDVTVRMRGVMEKCTFCVQRLEQAKIAQKVKAGASGDVAVKDGAMITACQQACPAGAITFGNMLDPESAVSKIKLDPRNYSVLGFLDTRPRVTYLARIRNPNPAMPDSHSEGPDSLLDYELHSNENPFKKGTGHAKGDTGDHGFKNNVAVAVAGKGAI